MKNKRKHPDHVLLRYLNTNSLRYKFNDVRVLVSKFLAHYLVKPKLIKNFQIRSFLLETMTYEIVRKEINMVEDCQNLLGKEKD